MSEQEQDKPIITDKRGQKKPPAQERLEEIEAEGIIDPTAAEPELTAEELEAGMARIAELREKFSADGTLNDDDAQELLELQARMQPTENAGQLNRCVTAFIVAIYHDGSAMATSDLNAPYVLDREANVHDMIAGCANVTSDLQVSKMMHTMEIVGQHRMAQLQEQQAAAAVKRAISRPGSLPRPPGH